jgi:hypothetical protein
MLQRYFTKSPLLNRTALSLPSFTHDSGNRIDYPTAYTNVFDMVNMLPGTRSTVSTSSTADVGAIASSNATAAGIVVYNYNFDYTTETDQSKNETVNVSLSHLPFNGPVTIKRYVVDQNTSNVQKLIDAGTTPTLAGSALQMTEQYTVNGALVLAAQAMTPSSVSLWTISIQ